MIILKFFLHMIITYLFIINHFQLSKQWLRGSFQEKTVAMNELSLVISVKHTSAEKTMPRTPSRTSAAVFGVKISSCARKEGKTVPSIVTSCLQEVEKRGVFTFAANLDGFFYYHLSKCVIPLQPE